MDLDDILFNTCHGINHITSNLDKSLHKNKPELENSFVDNFLHELNDFFYRESNILRLKNLPKDTIFHITEDTEDYIIAFVDKNKFDLPKNNGCMSDDVFFIPKDLCNFSNDESLFKTIDYEHQETYYKNCLQLKDGVYRVVDKNGNIITN